MASYRLDRERNKRFHYGDQWSDPITVDGVPMTEYQWLRTQGNFPLKNNLIRRLVRNVIGVYCNQAGDLQCTARDPNNRDLAAAMTTLLKYNSDLNRLSALYLRSLEEFLIGGLVVHRKWYGIRNGHDDCWTDYVAPQSFFVDTDMSDFRSWDCAMVGQIHDVTIERLCQQFARDKKHKKQLEKLYEKEAAKASVNASWSQFGQSKTPNQDFLSSPNENLCRVIEVWRKELDEEILCHDTAKGRLYVVPGADEPKIDAINRKREADGKGLILTQHRSKEVWRYFYLTPWGEALDSGTSPYSHGEHPYVMKAYPMIDGEIHAFVSDVIDQQKYTNRLITLYDWIVRSSAKGVLLVPEDCIPRGCTPQQFAAVWTRFNGVLVYSPSINGEIPKQVASNSTNIGITELLNLQMKLMEDISGVHGALEGKLSNAQMSGTLYNQQIQNATMALTDILGTFNEFVRDAAYKDVSNMQQFYDAERIAGMGIGKDAKRLWQPLKSTEFYLSIKTHQSSLEDNTK